jgi:hypothetical protein
MICVLAWVAVLAIGAVYVWELLHPFDDMEYDDGNPEQ